MATKKITRAVYVEIIRRNLEQLVKLDNYRAVDDLFSATGYRPNCNPRPSCRELAAVITAIVPCISSDWLKTAAGESAFQVAKASGYNHEVAQRAASRAERGALQAVAS